MSDAVLENSMWRRTLRPNPAPKEHEMQAALFVCVVLVSSAFQVAGLPLTVKKGEALPIVDDRDMVVAPAAGHSVGRGEARLVSEMHPAPQQQQVNKAAANKTSSTTAVPASKAGDKKSDDVGATTEFSPLGPSGPTKVNSGALLRSFYVFMGLGFMVLMYFVARSVRWETQDAVFSYLNIFSPLAVLETAFSYGIIVLVHITNYILTQQYNLLIQQSCV